LCPVLSTDTAAPQADTLSLHDALPISPGGKVRVRRAGSAEVCRSAASGPEASITSRVRPALRPSCSPLMRGASAAAAVAPARNRSEEHTSELQSRENLVCRLLLEKKKK